ncbi:hypothetical protein KDL01_15010 [Actinospica durhamensis]|uniref:Uncharacterized protein n=1 Tax=Actinospica durhamensis TaxID=1508375 RepID=A0A941IQT9_9ACTN|nr:hypothetical protein [Actinospica durhamensis]MBR7834582.1 hypothetical protein [Actinospica durhamensis]
MSIPMRGRLAAGAVASIVVGAAIGFGVVHSRDTTHDRLQAAADATASAQARLAVIQAPVTAGVRSDGSHYGSLFAYLLPLPSTYSLGPAVGTIGDNDYVSAAQVNAQVQGQLLKLPKSDMTNSEGTLADLHLQGIAVRTMVNGSDTDEFDFELMQLDPKAASSDEKLLASFVDGLGFRQGASVPGYGSAVCVLPPELGSDKVDSMVCAASYGDVEVLLEASGVAPLDQNTAVHLLAQQLDRLKSNQTLTAPVSPSTAGGQNA